MRFCIRPRFDAALVGSAAEPLWQLLYRYWFWGWLFADAHRGDRIRRRAALRHNVMQRVHLPCYMRRWLAFVLLAIAVGFALERLVDAPILTASAYTLAVLAVSVEVVASAAWLLLGSLSAPSATQ